MCRFFSLIYIYICVCVFRYIGFHEENMFMFRLQMGFVYSLYARRFPQDRNMQLKMCKI